MTCNGIRGLPCIVVCALPLLVASGVRADPPAEPLPDGPSAVQFDVEVDPLAYAFEGYSLHVGLRTGISRLALGAFAAAYPDPLKANRDLDARQSGAGIKLDFRPFRRAPAPTEWQRDLLQGPFVGLGASYSWLFVREPRSGGSDTGFQVRLTVRCGWGIPLAWGLYVTPWASVGYVLGARDLIAAGEIWEAKRLTLFATVHLGWRLP